MTYQVNGTTIIDSSRNFQSSAFSRTINGQNIIGSGDLRWNRPLTWGAVGTYGVFVSTRGSNYDYVSNNTVSGSNLYYTGSSNLGYSYPMIRANSNVQSGGVGGTWKHTSFRSRSIYGSDRVPAFWCRIS